MTEGSGCPKPPAAPTRVYSADLAQRHQDRIAEAGGEVVPLDMPPGTEPAVLLRTVGPQPVEAFRSSLVEHPDVAWAHTVGAGPDDLIDLIPPDVIFTRGPGPSAGPVAEYALTSLLFLTRGFGHLVETHRERRWSKPHRAPRFDELRVVIVGWGPIGQEFHRRCDTLGITTDVVRRTPEPGAIPPQHAPTKIIDRFALADAAVLLCPLTPDTRNLIGAAELDALGPSGFLVNVSRGGVVNQRALATALRDDRLGGAVIDVTEPEPLPRDDPLWRAPRCLITPHLGGFAGQNLGEEVIGLFCENLRRYRSGEPLMYVVDPERGY